MREPSCIVLSANSRGRTGRIQPTIEEHIKIATTLTVCVGWPAPECREVQNPSPSESFRKDSRASKCLWLLP